MQITLGSLKRVLALASPTLLKKKKKYTGAIVWGKTWRTIGSPTFSFPASFFFRTRENVELRLWSMLTCKTQLFQTKLCACASPDEYYKHLKVIEWNIFKNTYPAVRRPMAFFFFFLCLRCTFLSTLSATSSDQARMAVCHRKGSIWLRLSEVKQ